MFSPRKSTCVVRSFPKRLPSQKRGLISHPEIHGPKYGSPSTFMSPDPIISQSFLRLVFWLLGCNNGLKSVPMIKKVILRLIPSGVRNICCMRRVGTPDS